MPHAKTLKQRDTAAKPAREPEKAPARTPARRKPRQPGRTPDRQPEQTKQLAGGQLSVSEQAKARALEAAKPRPEPARDAKPHEPAPQGQLTTGELSIARRRAEKPDKIVEPVKLGGGVTQLTLVALSPTANTGDVPSKAADGSIAWAPPAGGGGGAAALTPTAVKTANYTAVVGDFVPCDVSAGGFTVTLPTAPADKSQIGIKIIGQAALVNALTISRGGTAVFNKAGGSTSLTLTALFQDAVLQYKASTGVWYVLSTDSPVSAIETVNTVATAGAAQTLPDPGLAGNASMNRYTLTVASCAFTFPAAAAGKSFLLALVQDATGSRAATWPGTVKWAGGVAPALTTTPAKVDLLSFVCLDGVNWLGSLAGANF